MQVEDQEPIPGKEAKAISGNSCPLPFLFLHQHHPDPDGEHPQIQNGATRGKASLKEAITVPGYAPFSQSRTHSIHC